MNSDAFPVKICPAASSTFIDKFKIDGSQRSQLTKQTVRNGRGTA